MTEHRGSKVNSYVGQGLALRFVNGHDSWRKRSGPGTGGALISLLVNFGKSVASAASANAVIGGSGRSGPTSSPIRLDWRTKRTSDAARAPPFLARRDLLSMGLPGLDPRLGDLTITVPR
jgi:hypothetical protein